MFFGKTTDIDICGFCDFLRFMLLRKRVWLKQNDSKNMQIILEIFMIYTINKLSNYFQK